MKNLVFLTILLIFNFKITAQDKKEWITFNFGLTHPIFTYPAYYEHKYTLNPEIEMLLNFPVFETIKLSTGCGLQFGEYNSREEVSKLLPDNEGDLYPWEYTYDWKLSFTSLYIPIMIEIPINNSFLNSFIAAIDIGKLIKYDLSEKHIRDVSYEKINRYYLDWNFGLKKDILQSKLQTVSLSPYIGFRTYLTKNNSWQKNHFFYGVKLSYSIKF
jgi:hypothetical protein